MFDLKSNLGTPAALAPTRAVVHKAVQLLTTAARANLNPLPDGSHSSLEWSPEKEVFLTHPLPVKDGVCQVGLSPTAMMLVFICSDGQSRQLSLAGRRYSEALAWLDLQLEDEGLFPATDTRLPYALPDDVAGIETFPAAASLDLDAFIAWYDLAVGAMEPLVRRQNGIDPGPSPIRCWPHHFDIATYVALDPGNPETARGIGVGLSPGDDSYNQPYFYVSPWPQPDPATLPPAIAPGHWHTEGFVGAVATGDEVLTLPEIGPGTQAFLRGAFNAARKVLVG